MSLDSLIVPLQNNRKNLVPSPLRRKQFKRFFDCAGKVMEEQLLKICKRSLRDFVNYVVNGKVNIYNSLCDRSTRNDFQTRKHARVRRFLPPLIRCRARVIGTLRDTISINFCLSRLFKARPLVRLEPLSRA